MSWVTTIRRVNLRSSWDIVTAYSYALLEGLLANVMKLRKRGGSCFWRHRL
jgi:hypothetical protein